MPKSWLLCTSLLAGVIASPTLAASLTSPNVLLIITDQQHAGMLSAAGNPYLSTPAMDSLAAIGVRFERARFSQLLVQELDRRGLETTSLGLCAAY